MVALSDGDTVSVLQEGKAVKVRLHGIDTPERKQPYGTRAQQYASGYPFPTSSCFFRIWLFSLAEVTWAWKNLGTFRIWIKSLS